MLFHRFLQWWLNWRKFILWFFLSSISLTVNIALITEYLLIQHYVNGILNVFKILFNFNLLVIISNPGAKVINNIINDIYNNQWLHPLSFNLTSKLYIIWRQVFVLASFQFFLLPWILFQVLDTLTKSM